jgi:N-acetylmuramoyl-L-alanine amidase
MHSTSKIRIIVTLLILMLNSLVGFSQSNTFKVTIAGHAHDFGAVYEGRIEKILLLFKS